MSEHCAANCDEQRAEVRRYRTAVAERQMNAWREEAATPMLNGEARFLILLAEGCRHECSLISKSSVDATQAKQAMADVRASYRMLILEAKRMFRERKLRGASAQELLAVSGQATSSFASVFPWSDGIRCDAMSTENSNFAPMASRNLVRLGASGTVMMCSFAAATTCSQVKSLASIDLKMRRMGACQKHACTADTVDEDVTTRCSCNSIARREDAFLLNARV